jgi:hypothetical protein
MLLKLREMPHGYPFGNADLVAVVACRSLHAAGVLIKVGFC